jgi:ATP-dependent DNA helicase PIF1
MSHYHNPFFFQQRAILAPTNNEIRKLNATILASLPGEERTYTSADSYTIENPLGNQNPNIPLEFLHSLNASGLPVAHLRLKLGCPIILLRNIDKKRGLCNGTHGTIKTMTDRVLEITIITGVIAGETALIPCISLTPSLTGLNFAINLKRRQYPIQLAFAISVAAAVEPELAESRAGY